MQCFNRQPDMPFNYDISGIFDADIERFEIFSEKLSHLCSPHQFICCDDIYGRNSIMNLVMSSPNIIKRWPKFTPSKHPLLASNATSKTFTDELSQKIDFYKTTMDAMTNQYMKYITEHADMDTYDTIVNKAPVLIDITKTIDKDIINDTMSYAMPRIIIPEKITKYLQQRHNWYAFCPPYKEMTIKANKDYYTHILIKNIDQSRPSITFRMDTYSGNKKDWMQKSGSVTKISFAQNKNTLSCEFTHTKCLTTGSLLTHYIKHMHWSKEKTQMWLDLFGENYIDKKAIVTLSVPSSNDIPPFDTLVNDMDALREIIRASKIPIHIERISQNNDLYQAEAYKTASLNAVAYLKMISLINNALFSNPKNQISENEYAFDNIFIKSNIQPIISSKTNLLQIKED